MRFLRIPGLASRSKAGLEWIVFCTLPGGIQPEKHRRAGCVYANPAIKPQPVLLDKHRRLGYWDKTGRQNRFRRVDGLIIAVE